MKETISAAFPFTSKFVEVNGNKIHYIDEGKGDPILFLHGNPTSSYLWRNIIPHLTEQGRCIAPDLIGMGKSDQPDIEYGFETSYAHLKGFIEALDLKQITLVIHDWGSGLGFHYANEHRDNIKGIAFMEAVYRLLDWSQLPGRLKVGMRMMRFSATNWLMLGAANLFVKKMIPTAIMRELSREEKQYYAAPYPTIKSRKPVRVWPQEIPKNGKPVHTHKAITAYHEWLKETSIPKLCIYAKPGMLIREEEIPWIEKNFPNTKTVCIGEGLHFIQEDAPHEIGAALSEWYKGLI